MIDRECTIGDDGFSVQLQIKNPQWFQLNTEQDNCIRACTDALNQKDIPAKEKRAINAQISPACRSERVKTALLEARETTATIREAEGIKASMETQQAVNAENAAEEACSGSFFLCSLSSVLLVIGPTADVRTTCIDECGAANSNCNALVTRGTGYLDDGNIDSKAAETARVLSNACSEGVLSTDTITVAIDDFSDTVDDFYYEDDESDK